MSDVIQTDAMRRSTVHRSESAVAIQRHASFEHALMGDADPKAIGDAPVSQKNRQHVLSEQYRQTTFFLSDATRDPRPYYPNVRWIQLRGSKLWVSYGELNALADYLPDSNQVDSMQAREMIPIIQRMRSIMSAQVVRLPFAGEASAGNWEAISAVRDEKAMDAATSGLGANRYFGLVARNACHFAPFSWHRWAHFHNEATEHAQAYHRGIEAVRPAKDLDTESPEQLRQAWLKNGYGDHFLQDSFAAGHLVNKTLVMQWFVEFLNGMASKWWDLLGPIVWYGFDNTKPWYGMPSTEIMQNMGTASQSGIAGRHLYGNPPSSTMTATHDRISGDEATDPQSAQERWSPEGRLKGSGVQATLRQTKAQNYQTYLSFLNSTFIQMAAGAVHDHFNKEGMSVANERGDSFNVGGDDTLLTQSGPVGAHLAAEASSMSRKAIDETSKTGSTDNTVERIWALVPTYIWTNEKKDGWKKLSLADWHDEVLKGLCWKSIFPDVVDSFQSKSVRGLNPTLSEAGLEGPLGIASPPVPSEMGDFVIAKGVENMA